MNSLSVVPLKANCLVMFYLLHFSEILEQVCKSIMNHLSPFQQEYCEMTEYFL